MAKGDDVCLFYLHSLCCMDLEIKEDPEEFYNKLLPSAVDNLLFLGRRLQARFVRTMKVFELADLMLCSGTVDPLTCFLTH